MKELNLVFILLFIARPAGANTHFQETDERSETKDHSCTKMANIEQNSEPLQAIKGQELVIPWTIGKKETVSSRDHAPDHIPTSVTFSVGQNNIKSEVPPCRQEWRGNDRHLFS